MPTTRQRRPARRDRRTAPPLVIVLLGALIGLSGPAPSVAFEQEAHYYLRFAFSLATCFDWDEAHLIASGDWMMDSNPSTHAEMTPVRRKNKIGFHAFGHSDARFNEIWQRTRAEPDPELRLIKLGQFMHFLEDWESHAGFGVRLGHAKATVRGRDPDSLGNDRDKNQRMVQSALEHLLRTCTDIGRTGDPTLPADPDYYLVWLMRLILQDGLMDDLFEIGDPAWKKATLGGIRSSHREVSERSRTRIEQFVKVLQDYPAKKVPDWFTPGDPERGIPPALQIPYDANADILARPGDPDPVEQILESNRLDREEENVTVHLDSYSRFQGGFAVRLAAANIGSEPSDPGTIDVYVIDAASESELGSATVELEALAAGETIRKQVRIRTAADSGREVMIGALARVADFSTMDNESWLMDEEAASQPPETPLVTDIDPDLPGPETLSFSSDPKLWLMDEAFCALIAASSSEGDATEKLVQVGFEVVTATGATIGTAREFEPRWGASALEGHPVIAARTFACFPLRERACGALAEHEDESALVRLTLGAPGLDSVTREDPVPAEVLAKARQICAGVTGG